MADVFNTLQAIGERGLFTGGVTKGGKKLPKDEKKIVDRFEKDKKFNDEVERESPHPNPILYYGQATDYAHAWVEAELHRMGKYRDTLNAELTRRSQPSKPSGRY